MELVKTTADYKIFKKRSGRYAVQSVKGAKKYLNGEEKAKVLLAEGLIKAPAKKVEAPAPAPAEEAPAEAVAAE